jgi:hypothetical protein
MIAIAQDYLQIWLAGSEPLLGVIIAITHGGSGAISDKVEALLTVMPRRIVVW